MKEHHEQIFIAEFHKNSLQLIKAHLVPWKNETYVDVRLWERSGKEGTEYPTTRGIRFNAELLPDLIRLLGDVERAIEKGKGEEAVMVE